MLVDEMSQISNNWLIADIGATTSRIATFNGDDISEVQIYRNDDAENLCALIGSYRSASQSELTRCALAVAAPIDGDEVELMNRDWRFSRGDIEALGFSDVDIINDFHAIAYALPTFDDSCRQEIGTATHYRDGCIATLGPGSGLGMAAWMAGGAAMYGEGGHITVSGRNAAEDAIIANLRERFGHCSAERILSGPGLVALHEAMHGEKIATSEEITGNPDMHTNQETLQQFFRFLGSAAADLALITGASGGVYIAGGIVPACLEQIIASDFRARFEDKNRYRDYMRAIPTWVITDPVPGLTGLAAYLRKR
jgi:glucokinase